MRSRLISSPLPWIPRRAGRDEQAMLSRRAFTLVEILLVLAMMALTGAVLLPVAGAFFRNTTQENPGEIVAEVLQEVRREAILAGRPVTLRFDREAQRFTWNGNSGGARAAAGPRLNIDFLRASTTSAVLIGGRLVETGAMDSLTFYPDGTCDPVRVQLRPASGGAVRVLSIDPWTCAPGLEVSS